METATTSSKHSSPRVISILSGGPGNDTLNARDNDVAFAEIDSLLCDLGTDRFAKDPADTQRQLRDRAALTIPSSPRPATNAESLPTVGRNPALAGVPLRGVVGDPLSLRMHG